VWAAAPTADDVHAAVAAKVRNAELAGLVAIQCDVVRETGKLTRCVAMNASNSRVGFQEAAGQLASKFQISPDEMSDPKKTLKVNLDFDFPAMSGEGWEKRYLTHPQWKPLPKGSAVVALLPAPAVKAGLTSGSALVECHVAAGGALADCSTIQESAPNLGLGDAALAVVRSYSVNPWDSGGLPTQGAFVRLSIPLTVAQDSRAGPPRP
jgi:TonB family protein